MCMCVMFSVMDGYTGYNIDLYLHKQNIAVIQWVLHFMSKMKLVLMMLIDLITSR